jgi:hypothetical protein
MVLKTFLLLVIAATFAFWAVHVRPMVGGDDFFGILCFSRDLAAGATDVSFARYDHFPGAYAVFTPAIEVLGGSLERLQWLYLIIMALSALLTGVVAWRATESFDVGVVAGFLAHGLGLWSQSLDGGVEALAPIPALVGLAVCAGQPFAGGWGVARACLLGAALGLALAVMPEAGLISLGIAAFLVRPPRRPLLLVPVLALIAFVLAILHEGHALLPIRLGLEAVVHGAHGGFVSNVFGSLPHPRVLGPVFVVSGVLLLVWLWILLRWPGLRVERWVAMLGFAAIASFAGFVAFAWRDSTSSVLLVTPFLAIALALFAPRSEPVLAVLGVAGLALWAGGSFPERFRNEDQVQLDLAKVRLSVNAAKDELVVFPLERNELHYALGTRVRTLPRGYFSASLGGYRDLDWGRVTAVLVSRKGRPDPEREVQDAAERREMLDFLGGYGLKPVVKTETLTLFRRS